jgi:hypothetical protein
LCRLASGFVRRAVNRICLTLLADGAGLFSIVWHIYLSENACSPTFVG